MNFIKGTAGEGEVVVPGLGQSIPMDIAAAHKGKAVDVGLRPEHLMVDRAGTDLTVDMTESLGGVSYAYLESRAGDRIVVEERGDDRVSAGETVSLKFEARRAYLFDAETERRIRT